MELHEAAQEAEAYLIRAKKQRAEVEKARGFFKKGAPRDGSDKHTGAMKQKLPCLKCGQLGHCHKDPTCPKSNDPFPARDGKAKGKGSGKKKRKKKKK